MTRAPAIGLVPWAHDYGEQAAALASQAELADQLGFHSFWVPESHFGERNSCPAPLLLLAAAAARTQRLRLGTTSYLLPIRNALQTAEAVAVLDRISEGRVIFGVGRGFDPALFEAFDVPSSEKRTRFEDALEQILAAWRGDPLPAGEALRLAPLPVQRPHPPVWVAAFGPKAMAQAGRLGLPYLASPVEPLARLAENYARHRDFLPDADCAGARIVPVMRSVFVCDDAGACSKVADALAQQASRLARSRAATLRRAAAASAHEWALIGSRDGVAEQIARYTEALGVTHLIARTAVPGAEPAQVLDSIHALAELQSEDTARETV